MATMGGNLQLNHTAGHKDCPACARAITLNHGTLLTPEMTFREAFEIWIDQRVIHSAGASDGAQFVSQRRGDDLRRRRRASWFISQRREKDLRQCARAAGRFFDQLKLSEIHVGHLRSYQRLRATNPPDPDGVWFAIRGKTVKGPYASREDAEKWTHGRGDGFEYHRTAWARRAGANLICREIYTVVNVMMAAGAWEAHHEAAFEPPAHVESNLRRAMTPQEQQTWLQVASSREEWRLVYWWSIVAMQTTCSTNELRALRLGDIFLEQGILTIGAAGAKNKYRIRTIPLTTPEVLWSLQGLMERARQLGAAGPQDYLFPKHKTADRYDPAVPMTVWGMRKPWDAVRAASGVEWVTPYCLRHTAITRMAEAGTPIAVIMDFAGHISPRMQQHYTAISMQAKRRWAAAAWMGAEMPWATPPVPGAGMPAVPASQAAAAGGEAATPPAGRAAWMRKAG